MCSKKQLLVLVSRVHHPFKPHTRKTLAVPPEKHIPVTNHAVSSHHHARLIGRRQRILLRRRETFDFGLWHGGPHGKLLLPLLHTRIVDTQDNGSLFDGCGRSDTRQRLARSAGQHDDSRPRTPVSKHFGQRFLLIRLCRKSFKDTKNNRINVL